jgi:HD-GYP domain-containing protein (c-di-GMP phosphodiesterase class II)
MDRDLIPEAAGLIGAMNVFDPEMAQHLIATAAFAERVAIVMGLEEETVANCRLGALLHDIGRLGVDKSILTYPGMLVEAEWEILTGHSTHGDRLLLAIPSLAHIAPIVRAHHERMDGSGYPDALIGNEIPLEARIVSVADAFHTMTMPHVYRRASATTTAMEELIGNSGSQFDPTIVDAFGAMIGVGRRARARRA